MQVLIISLLLTSVSSIKAWEVNIEKEFSDKHLFEFAEQGPPIKNSVSDRQTYIQGEYPGRSINHIFFSFNIDTLRFDLARVVKEMIDKKRYVEHNKGKVNLMCTIYSNQFSSGVVWSIWKNGCQNSPTHCFAANSCKASIGVRKDSIWEPSNYTIVHLFPIAKSDCDGVKYCWGYAGKRSIRDPTSLDSTDDCKVNFDNTTTSPEINSCHTEIPESFMWIMVLSSILANIYKD